MILPCSPPRYSAEGLNGNYSDYEDDDDDDVNDHYHYDPYDSDHSFGNVYYDPDGDPYDPDYGYDLDDY